MSAPYATAPGKARPATTRFIWGAALVLAVLYLVAEHGEHLNSFLPLLFVLACPLMHLFMHCGHGKHGGEEPHH